MEQEIKKRIFIFLPWVLTFAVLGAFTLYGPMYKESFNPFGAIFKRVDLISTMRIHLHEANEAEKNAVLAIIDEDSEAFATQARQSADRVERSRKELESLILKDNLPREAEMINEFNSCWLQYRTLDETILTLATQNTNLKAQKVSTTQCAQEIQNFEESLNHIIQRNMNNSKCNEACILSYEALTAGLKILALHKLHIEEADDKQMDKIEQNIKIYDESARKALDSLRGIAMLKDNPDLRNAETAYLKFMNLTDEVLRLSRMNTNIKSAELSLGKKRLISSQCQENLAALQETVQVRQIKATR